MPEQTNNNKIVLWVGGVVLALTAIFLVWFFLLRSTASVSTNGTSSGGFTSIPDTTNTAPATTDTSPNQTINTTATAAAQKIFKISDGPIVGATLMQTLRPTTTIARYIRQDDGHVFDVPLGVAGVVPRVVSNITIPGGQRAIWLEGGNAAIMQYVDDANIVKTVYLGFPAASTTGKVLPTRIQFLPDNIIDIAGSPDGKSLAYLIKISGGSDGYIARSDGANSRKLFSLPLSQLLISWPSQTTIIAETRPAAGITGMAFSINAKSGAASQLVSAGGLTVTANPTFSTLLYQVSNGASLTSYLHDVKSGNNALLPVNPSPEQCLWSALNPSVVFCAAPKDTVPANYFDRWHQGLAASANAIFKIYTAVASQSAVAVPGSTDGGVPSDILEMALSPDEHYLSYTTKGGRTLWGVLLNN